MKDKYKAKAKAITLESLHSLANETSCDDFMQYVKGDLTGEHTDAVINCIPVVVDMNKLNNDRKTTS